MSALDERGTKRALSAGIDAALPAVRQELQLLARVAASIRLPSGTRYRLDRPTLSIPQGARANNVKVGQAAATNEGKHAVALQARIAGTNDGPKLPPPDGMLLQDGVDGATVVRVRPLRPRRPLPTADDETKSAAVAIKSTRRGRQDVSIDKALAPPAKNVGPNIAHIGSAVPYAAPQPRSKLTQEPLAPASLGQQGSASIGETLMHQPSTTASQTAWTRHERSAPGDGTTMTNSGAGLGYAPTWSYGKKRNSGLAFLKGNVALAAQAPPASALRMAAAGRAPAAAVDATQANDSLTHWQSAPSWQGNASPAPSPNQGPSSDAQRGMPGDVYLDGALVGRWMARHLTREIGRAATGASAFDPRRNPLPAGRMIGI